MNQAKIIAIDGDQVIFDFAEHWRCTAERVLDRSVFQQEPVFSLSRRFGLTHQDTAKVWDRFHQDGEWGRVPLLPQALSAVQTLLRQGWGVWVVSSVPDAGLAARRKQLSAAVPGAVFFQAESLDPRYPNGAPTKESILRYPGVQFFADDRWPHVAEAVRASVPMVCRIVGGHDGNGSPVADIEEYPDLPTALHAFRIL